MAGGYWDVNQPADRVVYPARRIQPYWDTHQPPDRRLPFGSGAPQAPTRALSPSINDQVLGVINPQLQAAADMINRRSSMASGAITGLTNSLAALTREYPGMINAAYEPEKGLANKTAAYARDALTGAGAQQGNDLAKVLGQAGIQGPGDINLAQQGKGAGGAAYGTGIAELDAMIAKQASAQTEAALEPSFAAGMGSYQQGFVAQQLARQLADQQSQIRGQIPQLVLDLTQRQQDVDYRNKTLAEQTREFNVGQRNTKLDRFQQMKAANEAATGYQWEITSTGVRPRRVNGKTVPVASVAAQNRKDQIDIILSTGIDPATGQLTPQAKKQLAALGINTAGGVDAVTARANAAAAAKQPTNTGPWYHDPNDGQWKVSPGYKQLPNGDVVKISTGKTVKMPTPKQLSDMVDTWYSGKKQTQLKKVGVDKQGNPIYRNVPAEPTGMLGYQQAYQTLRSYNVSDAKARQLLNTKYAKGDRGRPWLSAPERNLLKKAGARATALYDLEAHAYLGARQYKLLKEKGLLPNGEKVGDRYFTRKALTAEQRKALHDAGLHSSAYFAKYPRGYLNAAQVAALRKAGALPHGTMRNGRYYISPGG